MDQTNRQNYTASFLVAHLIFKKHAFCFIPHLTVDICRWIGCFHFPLIFIVFLDGQGKFNCRHNGTVRITSLSGQEPFKRRGSVSPPSGRKLRGHKTNWRSSTYSHTGSSWWQPRGSAVSMNASSIDTGKSFADPAPSSLQLWISQGTHQIGTSR